ncbi:MAG: NnrS family protein [Pseudomonadota bacterium]
MSLLKIDEAPVSLSPSPWRVRHPLWALGFRPFYLLAGALAVLAVPLWLAQYLGWLHGWPNINLAWHMHEMVFGMAVAVIIGFLFTAGRTWTGLQTPQGASLAGLALLWIAGRVAMLAAPPWLAAPVDLLFLPLAAWAMYSVLRKSGNTRNLPLVGLLALLTLANAVFHASVLGMLALSPVAPVHAAILIIVIIESVIGGRVIPMFTNNGAPGAGAKVHPRVDKTALGLMAAAGLAWVAGLQGWPMALLAGLAGAASLWRLSGWKPQRTLGKPLLWILHLGYAWIGIGFLLLGLAAAGIGSASTAIHALAVGSMAGLIIGMMTRTTLGHTGRVMAAGRAEPAMFGLIQAGALLRVLAGFAPADWRDAALLLSALCWSASFALFIVVYAPYLWRARIDGKEG